MRNRNLNVMKAILATAVMLSASACRRAEEGVVSYTIDDEVIFARDVMAAVMSASHSERTLEFERIRRCVENGFLMAHARLRYAPAPNFKVIPLYCRLSAAEAGADGGKNCFSMNIWGFGEREAWSEMSRIWIVLETFDQQQGRYETIASSLKDIVQEHSHIWRGENFGESDYRCGDPQLGLGDDDGSWLRNVAKGDTRMYLLLTSGRASLPNRMSRVVYDALDWERRVNIYKSSGRLVRLVPFFQFDGGCFLECQ